MGQGRGDARARGLPPRVRGGRGGRIVAASEMLRPSVGHFQQAEVMPPGFKK